MKKTHTIIFLVFFCVSACVSDQLEYVVSQQVRLFEAIKAYEFNKGEVAKLVEGGIKEARTNLSNKKMKVISYQPIAFEWKARLAKIDYELETLTERLNKIDEIATIYFEKLDTVTNSIKDEALKKNEQRANHKLREEWDSLYKIGVQSLKDIKRINKKGQDVRKVIINDGLRQKNENSLKALKKIEQEYNAVLALMSDFSCRAAKKISIENADLKSVCGKKPK